MPRKYTHVQKMLPRVLAMKGEGYTNRQIADQFATNCRSVGSVKYFSQIGLQALD